MAEEGSENMIKWITEFIKRYFKKDKEYLPEKMYMVYLDDIKISHSFAATTIRPKKWERKVDYYFRTGEFESSIVLNHDFILVNGYSTYKIAEKFGIKKVPAYFLPAEGTVSPWMVS